VQGTELFFRDVYRFLKLKILGGNVKKLEKKHLRVIRWAHWINFPLLFLMIWSGLLIYWSNDVYKIQVGDHVLFKFFPDWFYKKFNIEFRLAEGMSWHFFLMWLFAVNGIVYVLYSVISGEWRYLVPNKNSFKEAIQVVLYDLHLSKNHPPPRKYNGAQQIAYTSIIIMGGLSLLTGLAIYKPTQFSWLTALLGGYGAARLEHFLLTLGYVAFFLIHITQVIKTGWNNARGMITGYEIVNEEAVHE
jgi:thiosulfate reductase cytochrome b subunit